MIRDTTDRSHLWRGAHRIICGFLMTLWLSGCSEPSPLPPDKRQYVGLWVASDRYISIFSNGRLEQKEKLRFGMHNRVQSNFEFNGNVIETAMFARFIVNTPPYQHEGQWVMVVDGVTYTRVGPPVTYGRSNHWPTGIQ